MNAELAREIDSLVNQADTIANDARRVFGGLTKEQLNWKPSAERWSVAQCFDHLITTNSGYLPIVDDVLAGQKKSSVWQKIGRASCREREEVEGGDGSLTEREGADE